MEGMSARELESVLEEHRKLRGTLIQIEEAVAHPPASKDRPEWIHGVADRLRELRPRLRAHFAHEEQSGLFDDIQRSWPGSAHRCRLLMDEHIRLLTRVDNVFDDASRETIDDECFRSVVMRLRWLLSDLALHETLENELLYRSLEGGPGALD